MKQKLKTKNKDKPKIFERNSDTGVIRWRYVGESLTNMDGLT